PQPPQNAVLELLGNLGRYVVELYQHIVILLAFIGMTLAGLASSLLRPGTWRVTSIVAQIEQIALNAVAIVALLTFMVCAVIAILGATVPHDLGAPLCSVDMIPYSHLRDFAVLLPAILLAGRTASAFPAPIGSMKAN